MISLVVGLGGVSIEQALKELQTASRAEDVVRCEEILSQIIKISHLTLENIKGEVSE